MPIDMKMPVSFLKPEIPLNFPVSERGSGTLGDGHSASRDMPGWEKCLPEERAGYIATTLGHQSPQVTFPNSPWSV